MIKENSLSNFWIEISQSLTHLDPDRSKPINEKNSWRQFASSWRHFGIARILFGSDQTVGENGISEDRYDQGKTFEEEVASINSDPFLSPDEKHLILKKNGEQFLKLICDSCSTYPPVSQ